MIDFFKLHVSDYGDALLGMPDENVGKIIKGLVEYSMDKEHTPIEDSAVSGLYTVMRLHIDRDEKYRNDKINAGRNGGLAKAGKAKQNVAEVSKGVAEVSKDVAECSKVKQSLPPIPYPYPNPYPNPDNKDLKEKNIKEKDLFAEDVISYLNFKAGTHYRAVGKTLQLINARVNEGYTTDDFKKVIDKKCKEWLGTPYEKFLRPSTLFAPSHFEEYLNQPEEQTSDDMFMNFLKGDTNDEGGVYPDSEDPESGLYGFKVYSE